MALVSDPSPNAPVFHLPYGMRYECLQDGACCHLEWWDIHVSPDEADRILAEDWRSSSSVGETDETPFSSSVKDSQQRILKRVDAKCSFLGEDNLCRLHADIRLDIKPLACQRFPFRFVQAPDGVYVGLSFVCPSVVHNIGIPIEDQFEDIKKDFILRPSSHRLQNPVRFDAAKPIEWEDYLLIEQTLDDILSHADYNVGQCMVAGHAWLGILRKMLYSPDMPPGLTPSQLARFYVNRTRAEGLSRPFQIAQQTAANAALKRMLLGSFVSFRNTLLHRKGRLSVTMDVVFQNLRHWFRLGKVQLPSVRQEFLYSDFKPDPTILDTPEMQSLLRRYFRHTLFRKDMVRHTDIFWGYCYLVLIYGLIQWYATALQTAGETDLTRAVSLVERYYVHHTDFDQLFLHHPALAQTVQHLFKKPNFAHSIVMG